MSSKVVSDFAVIIISIANVINVVTDDVLVLAVLPNYDFVRFCLEEITLLKRTSYKTNQPLPYMGTGRIFYTPFFLLVTKWSDQASLALMQCM